MIRAKRLLLCNATMLIVAGVLCALGRTEALSVRRSLSLASFEGAARRAGCDRSPTSFATATTRGRICMEMESAEYIASDNNNNDNDNESNNNNNNNNDRPLTEVLGDATLGAVQSLARIAGSSAGTEPADDIGATSIREYDARMGIEEYAADGYTKGAFGIANVLSGRGPASRRSRLIQWQRRSLSDVRKETMTYASALNGGEAVSGGSEDEGRGATVATPSSSSSSSSSSEGKTRRGNKNGDGKDPTLITTALQTLEKDMALLDNLASSQPQLSLTEVGLLIGAVLASGMGPIAFPGTSVTEVLAPAAAAFSASITIGSEYIGRVAVADGKEIAANSIQCAAEAEALLANAERVKAITPLCVGVCATCASFALLTPTLVDALNIGNSVIMMTEIYLLCPLVSVLSAAVANLALEETRSFSDRAINVGVRRFSKSGNVGRTWLSTSEQVRKNSRGKTERWQRFAGSVLPAPIVGSVLGGPSLSAKCIAVAALAAAQSAYFLAQSESVLARAQDAVALKARSAAVSDTYANQGARNSAILPFTSALSAFCAAATAATVELPFIENISAIYGTFGEVALVSAFPILSSGFAAAAAVSKARCEVDAEAAAQAASTLALEYDGMDGSGDDPVLRPFQAVKELVMLAVKSGWRSVKKGVIKPFWNVLRLVRRSSRQDRRGGEGLA